MFAQDASRDVYLDRFFEEHPHPGYSWINDLGKGRHMEAANALLDASNTYNQLEGKHVRLSTHS